MQTLFFRFLFIFLLSIAFSISVKPDNPAVYNHYLINKVFFASEKGADDIDIEIKNKVQFLKIEERFYYDYLISDISNILKSGLVQDVNVQVKSVGNNGVNIYFEIIKNPVIENVELINVHFINKSAVIASLNNQVEKELDYLSIKKDVKIIEDKYESQGYVLGRVTNVLFLDDSNTLVFYVEEGEIDKIILKGIEHVNTKLVYREMNLGSGSVLNMKQLREDRLAIMRLGYFSRVSVPTIVQSTEFPGRVDVIYDLAESKINNLQVGLEQLPNNYYSLTYGLRFPNFRNQGDGIYLKAQTLIRGALEDYNYYLKYNEPWPFGIKMPFNFILWHQVNKENVLGTSSSVSVRRRGWEANLQPIYFADRQLLVGFSQEDVQEVIGTYSPYYTSALRAAFIQNTIKNQSHPTAGTMHALEVERGNNLFGIINYGGIEYAKYEFKYSLFTEPIKNGVVGVHFEAGYLDAKDSAILLFEQDMFSVGGSYSLRGYPDPYSNPASAITGKKKILVNLEYRTLLTDWFQLAAFTDWGYATSGPLNPSDFKWGGGIGFRFFTPLVPIRLDFGYSDEENFVFHFGLGQIF